MAKKSKRYTEAAALIENGKLYSAEEAIELVKKNKKIVINYFKMSKL